MKKLRKSTIATFLCATLFAAIGSGCRHVETPRESARGPIQDGAHGETLDRNSLALRYERRARSSAGAARDHQLLLAAREWMILGDTHRVEFLLNQISANVSGADRTAQRLLSAHLALVQAKPSQALDLLVDLRRPLRREDELDCLEMRTQALFALNRPGAAVVAAVERSALLDNRDAISDNQWLIWNGIKQSKLAGRDLLANEKVEEPAAGWLDLGEVALESSRDAAQAIVASKLWRRRHPGHPANDFLTSYVLPSMQAAETYPAKLALLLPLSGPRHVEAAELRDGFISALLQLDAKVRPVLNIYDSEAEGPLAAYRHAIAEGASFVVGPLLKENVEKLFASEQMSVPTLALNDPIEASPRPTNAFQFWLDPAEEARQIAAQVIDDGHSHGVALVPNNEWGARVLAAFDSELDARGGVLEGRQLYDAADKDPVALVARLLLVDESKTRVKELQSALHTQFKFELRPRADIDFVFLGAEPIHGQMFRMALRFFLRTPIPVYATSEIFDPGASGNSDLDGLSFPDMPWLVDPDANATQVRETFNRYWPDSRDRPMRLFAFGFDACRLIPLLLSRASAIPIRRAMGMSGKLTIDDDGNIHRSLTWVRMMQGVPARRESIDATLRIAGPHESGVGATD